MVRYAGSHAFCRDSPADEKGGEPQLGVVLDSAEGCVGPMRQLTPALAAAQAGTGKVVLSPDGFTFTRVQGQGPPVVLVHGMTSPSLVWERFAPLLAGRGYRVVCYDLFGRGLSARPNVAMDPALFHRQLDAVIADSGGEPPVVVGYSWGAGVVASWAACVPRDVGAVVLVAPGGVAESGGWGNAALRIPGVGEAIVAAGGRRGLLADVRRMFNSPHTAAEYLPRFVEQLEWEGYDRCFLASLRDCPTSWSAAYRALGRSLARVEVLWGDADTKVPVALAPALAALVPQSRLHVVAGGGHGMPWEAADAFAASLFTALSTPGLQPGQSAGPGPSS